MAASRSGPATPSRGFWVLASGLSNVRVWQPAFFPQNLMQDILQYLALLGPLMRQAAVALRSLAICFFKSRCRKVALRLGRVCSKITRASLPHAASPLGQQPTPQIFKNYDAYKQYE